jgi:hypothetical protein
METMTDAELLLASQQTGEAFCELYDRWAEPLLGFFHRRVDDAEIAADLMAETIATLVREASALPRHGPARIGLDLHARSPAALDVPP